MPRFKNISSYAGGFAGAIVILALVLGRSFAPAVVGLQSTPVATSTVEGLRRGRLSLTDGEGRHASGLLFTGVRSSGVASKSAVDPIATASSPWQHNSLQRLHFSANQPASGQLAGLSPQAASSAGSTSLTTPVASGSDPFGSGQSAPASVLGSTVPPQIRQWAPLIEKYAVQDGLDPNLIAAVMRTESNGNPRALSPMGAVGLMQVMNGSNDPETNIRQGAQILAQDIQHFNGDVELALSAYNAGTHAVDRFGGIPPYLETENYVFEVLNRYYLYSPSN